MVVALTARHWVDLVQMAGVDGPVTALEQALGADFSLESDRFAHREVLAALIQEWFARTTTGRACAALQGTSVLWERYRTFGEVVRSLQDSAGHPMMATIEQPGVGPYLAPASPLEFTSLERRVRRAPSLGEHTAQILREELRLSPGAIQSLVGSGVVA